MKNLLSFIFVIICALNCQAQTVGVLQNDSLSRNGYTLFAPSVSKMTYLIDNCGHLINSWESDYRPNLSVYLLEDGSLLRTARFSGPTQGSFAGGGIQKFNWEGDLIWEYSFVNSDFKQHHDIVPMPNGNILVLVYERVSSLTAIENGRDPNSIAGFIWPEKLIELEPTGVNSVNIVWEWRAWDHLVQDFDPSKLNYGVVSEHPEKFDVNLGTASLGDWMHINAIAYNESLDQIAMSSRTFEEIYIIDHSTTTAEAASSVGGNSGKGGDILYRWGNPFSYKRGTMADKMLYGQHNVHWIPDGLVDAGKLMVYNNGVNRPEGEYSTVDVLEPPVDADGNYIIGDDSPFGPSTLSWTYGSAGNSFYSSRISGAQRLSNGNTLICEGNNSRFFEVTYDGQKVWEYQSPIGVTGPIAQGEILGSSSVFRALRYAPDYPAFDDVEIVVGEVLELDPLPETCQIFDGSIIDNVVDELDSENKFLIAPNPVENEFSILKYNETPTIVQVLDITGAKLMTTKFSENQFLVASKTWSSGCYFIQIFDLDGQLIHVSKLIKL